MSSRLLFKAFFSVILYWFIASNLVAEVLKPDHKLFTIDILFLTNPGGRLADFDYEESRKNNELAVQHSFGIWPVLELVKTIEKVKPQLIKIGLGEFSLNQLDLKRELDDSLKQIGLSKKFTMLYSNEISLNFFLNLWQSLKFETWGLSYADLLKTGFYPNSLRPVAHLISSLNFESSNLNLPWYKIVHSKGLKILVTNYTNLQANLKANFENLDDTWRVKTINSELEKNIQDLDADFRILLIDEFWQRYNVNKKLKAEKYDSSMGARFIVEKLNFFDVYIINHFPSHSPNVGQPLLKTNSKIIFKLSTNDERLLYLKLLYNQQNNDKPYLVGVEFDWLMPKLDPNSKTFEYKQLYKAIVKSKAKPLNTSGKWRVTKQKYRLADMRECFKDIGQTMLNQILSYSGQQTSQTSGLIYKFRSIYPLPDKFLTYRELDKLTKDYYPVVVRLDLEQFKNLVEFLQNRPITLKNYYMTGLTISSSNITNLQPNKDIYFITSPSFLYRSLFFGPSFQNEKNPLDIYSIKKSAKDILLEVLNNKTDILLKEGAKCSKVFN